MNKEKSYAMAPMDRRAATDALQAWLKSQQLSPSNALEIFADVMAMQAVGGVMLEHPSFNEKAAVALRSHVKATADVFHYLMVDTITTVMREEREKAESQKISVHHSLQVYSTLMAAEFVYMLRWSEAAKFLSGGATEENVRFYAHEIAGILEEMMAEAGLDILKRVPEKEDENDRG
jgi:hypothetical protein